MQFPAVDEATWGLSSGQALQRFEDIAASISASFRIIGHRRKASTSHRGSYRFEATMEVPSGVATLFHSSGSGYRAQYYIGIENGEKANRYAVDAILPELLSRIQRVRKRSCPMTFVEASLLGSQTKLWIHQGAWLRQCRDADRLLFPPRWRQHAEDLQGERVRKLLRWGTLVPSTEARIEIKGTVVRPDGSETHRAFKSARSFEIHNYGFT